MIIKICGLTSVEDALYCLDQGADWIGVNLVAGPRCLSLSQALKLVGSLPDPHRAVALIRTDVDPSTETPNHQLRSLADVGLTRFQLYGSQPKPCLTTITELHGESILVQSVVDRSSFDALKDTLEMLEPLTPDYLLIDASAKGKWGGTGQLIEAMALEQALQEGCLDQPWPWLLAGGLNAENVAEMIGRFQPAGVDVCSGVENEPGIKDHRQVADFIRHVRQG